MIKKNVFPLLTLIMLLAVTTDASAKEGFYIAAGTTYNTIQGDFNGNSSLVGLTDEIIIPDIKSAFGLDISAGYGINDAVAFELDWTRTEHSGTWLGLTGDVTVTSISLNSKVNFRPDDVLQPYLLYGISHNELLIKKGAASTFTLVSGDAELSGIGYNLGAGIDNYFTPHISLSLSLMYHYIDYTEAEGLQESGKIDDGLNGSGFSFLLSTAYHF